MTKRPFALPGLEPAPEIRSMAAMEAYLAAHPEAAADPDHQVQVSLVLAVNCDICGPVNTWQGQDFGTVTSQDEETGQATVAFGEDSRIMLIDDADAFLQHHWETVHGGECVIVDTGSHGLIVRRKDVHHGD